ncbi:MAG: trehalose-phosphatase [Terriglobia bacterium]
MKKPAAGFVRNVAAGFSPAIETQKSCPAQAGLYPRLAALPNSKIPRLFRAWPRVVARLRRAKRVILFLDFDGTLVEYRSRPQDVMLPAPARAALARLACRPNLSVFLISGRRRADLERRARVPGVRYIGLHGWERQGRRSLRAQSRKSLDHARAAVAEAIDGLPGVWIEDKKFSFAVHYRRAPRSAARKARAVISRLIEGQPNGLYLLKGDKVIGVLPGEIEGKGQAVLDVLGKKPGGTLALYAGDDTTDETAFAALARRGITILVGPRRNTQARYKVRNPAELISFLQKLQQEMSA